MIRASFITTMVVNIRGELLRFNGSARRAAMVPHHIEGVGPPGAMAPRESASCQEALEERKAVVLRVLADAPVAAVRRRCRSPGRAIDGRRCRPRSSTMHDSSRWL